MQPVIGGFLIHLIESIIKLDDVPKPVVGLVDPLLIEKTFKSHIGQGHRFDTDTVDVTADQKGF